MCPAILQVLLVCRGWDCELSIAMGYELDVAEFEPG